VDFLLERLLASLLIASEHVTHQPPVGRAGSPDWEHRGVRTTMTITPEDCRIDADQLDPTAPGYGAHLPFHAILQRCGIAWRAHLGSLGHGVDAEALDTGVIVPNVNADFRAEVHVGELAIDVGLVAVGTSSFTLRCDVVQDDVVAASVRVVLVSFDYARRATVPLTAQQRALLEPGLAGS
jgi:acyl-CoA thioesterase FadM